MCVARTSARKRRNMKNDGRYKASRPPISKKLQGRAKLQAQQIIAQTPA